MNVRDIINTISSTVKTGWQGITGGKNFWAEFSNGAARAHTDHTLPATGANPFYSVQSLAAAWRSSPANAAGYLTNAGAEGISEVLGLSVKGLGNTIQNPFVRTAMAVYATSVGIVGPDQANANFAQAGQKLLDAVPEQVQDNVRQAGEQTIEVIRTMQDYVNQMGR